MIIIKTLKDINLCYQIQQHSSDYSFKHPNKQENEKDCPVKKQAAKDMVYAAFA
jgi:hypothetical protein